jgi:hypothetical protein
MRPSASSCCAATASVQRTKVLFARAGAELGRRLGWERADCTTSSPGCAGAAWSDGTAAAAGPSTLRSPPMAARRSRPPHPATGSRSGAWSSIGSPTSRSTSSPKSPARSSTASTHPNACNVGGSSSCGRSWVHRQRRASTAIPGPGRMAGHPPSGRSIGAVPVRSARPRIAGGSWPGAVMVMAGRASHRRAIGLRY